MSTKLITLSAIATFLGGAAMADVPNVAVDIAPVHSLVARVMQGVGEPSLIVAPGASPHEYSLRPSEATALQEADLVFWLSPNLTPWLDDAIDTLASDAAVTQLLEVNGTT
ncbi:MAG: zinc ABC transporter substrate-binding protein, partial [Luminiphilus sp.]